MQELAELEGLFDDEYVASLRSASGAHLTVLVRELESLHQTKNLVHVATNGAVVNGALTQLALTVDDEQTTEGGTSLLAHVDQDVVGRGDLLVEVGKERDVELTQTALLARSVDPRQVRELGVHAAAQHLTAKLAELRRLLAERDDLRGAHEGEVHGVEEEHNVLALVVGQRHSLELSVDDGWFEVLQRCKLENEVCWIRDCVAKIHFLGWTWLVGLVEVYRARGNQNEGGGPCPPSLSAQHTATID
ncbi:hypothetical protein GQ600_19336 [Phytophthora cactorum]|nr:hypothetical protein GQ600_19336 [Phytophthora cactorum]